MSPNKNNNRISRQPTYPGVYINEVPSGVHPVEGVPTSITAFLGCTKSGPLDQPVTINNYGDFKRIFGGMWNESPMSFAVDDYFVNEGRQAIIVRLDDTQREGNLDTQIIGSEDSKTGLYALEKADLFNILCIPPPSENKDIGAGVISVAADYCEKRRAMLIIDCPQAWNTTQDAKNGMFNLPNNVGTNSKNAAIFFPRIQKPNPLRNSKIETFAPCGAIAGVMTQIDAERGIWKAPAGTRAVLKGVTGFSVTLTDLDTGYLNVLGCNCLRSFTVYGNVIWGARTLAGADQLASEWKYIPVRRLALYIEESLYRGTQWVVFEPNDESLWAQIRLNIGAFMHNHFRIGAFRGSSPRDAYFIKCDKETTTQNDIDHGIVNILVGFAALKPAEFVIIKIQQIANRTHT